MEFDTFLPQLQQPTLFEIGETSSGAAELFPAVWGAAEALISGDQEARHAGLERLVELNAPRLSPLITHLFAVRITEPDVQLRMQIIKALAGVLSSDDLGHPAPEAVRNQLTGVFSRMRTREIYALLQAGSQFPDCEADVSRLLRCSPYAGNHLVEVLGSRKSPLLIRKLAVRMISQVGYVDAISLLERLLVRLESRCNGQQAMPFVPPTGVDDSSLLPDIQEALTALRAP